ncbi:MAG: hypothetical protein ACSHXF_14450 [Aquaticitalea sp.]
MLRRCFFLLCFCVLGLNGLFAQETFKMMFYNLLNFPSQDVPTNRIQYLEIILADYQPDIFMVCELNNENASNDILSLMQRINPTYAKALFVNNTSDDMFGDQNDLQNLLYYDATKFVLESQAIVPTLFRDFNHYKLKLNTIDQDDSPIYIDAIVCHLKASSGVENEAYRFQMVTDLVAYLETFPADSNVILAGDFNMYTNSEEGFVELQDATNTIVFADPANRVGSWHNNPNYIDVMTQSTRTDSGLGGATGGFDDRFDMILTSQNLITNTDLKYVHDSYSVFGNNNGVSCLNRAINSTNCAGFDYSFAIRDALYNFSDHLPVTIELETTHTLSVDDYNVLQPITFLNGNMLKKNLQLRINDPSLTNQTLNVYDSFGKLIKTINAKNSIYIKEDISMLATGLYFIVAPQFNMKPLKFVVTH